jgi:hypothetical protein
MANPNRTVLERARNGESVHAYALLTALEQERERQYKAEQERLRALEQEAKSIAEEAQAAIGEAYQSPFTRETALYAARIALGLTQTTEGEA